jgi:hypothetical protein
MSYKVCLIVFHGFAPQRLSPKRIVSEHKPQPSRKDYREEAARIRTVAMRLRSAGARDQLYLIASIYEKLAELVDVSDT